MRFRFIVDSHADYPVRILCDVLEVSPAGYYAWRSRPESPRSAANRELVDDIQRVHRDANGRYGSPRVHVELKAKGRGVSRGRFELAPIARSDCDGRDLLCRPALCARRRWRCRRRSSGMLERQCGRHARGDALAQARLRRRDRVQSNRRPSDRRIRRRQADPEVRRRTGRLERAGKPDYPSSECSRKKRSISLVASGPRGSV
jgi:hypothetical protein